MTPHWLKGSIWNLLGTGIPFVFAIACMPLLLNGLGAERYGLLILAWAVVGYFSIFDFGLSRAITQLVAKSYKVSPEHSAPVVVTGVLVLGILGTLGGLVLFLGAPLIDRVGRIPLALRHEAIRSVEVLGVGLPFVVISTGLRGALEGVFDFAWLNVIRVLSGIGTYLVPVAVMLISIQLDWICAGLVVLRALSCLAYYLRCRLYFGLGGIRHTVDVQVASRLLGYGGWITVSNLVSPVMAYLDRFLVAGAISVAMAGYYSTSQEIVTRFQIIPGSVLAVLFPAISRSHLTSPYRAGHILFRGSQFVTFAVLPLAAGCLLFAREGLGIWFGQDFARQAYVVAQVLTIGSFFNCVALCPFFYLQAVGRPDITAKTHLLELPLYLLLLWVLTMQWGVIGVAIAWSCRMACDLAILSVGTARQSEIMRQFVQRAGLRIGAPAAALTSLVFVESLRLRTFAFCAMAGLSAWVLWTEWASGEIPLVEVES
jgi:O-antigen/teichoic acid export membrane protein